ncbi:hypothetical protein Salat_1506500 [Sesamum alatum]|uniref:DUF4283 domain-containing protein n=1 Tax=Sesamum alatum TaxID=300844 RepID=A0AAE1YBT4_9LAMI|nr:hypothetical protein Salat_1506500 [Sesamum alatum]
MPYCFEFKEDDISFTPVWAFLPSLPIECWNPNALGKIGSRVSNPIAMDYLTRKMERVSYARILVEVDVSKPLVDKVEFILPNGVTRKQPVVYEFTPRFYSECCKFGHLNDACQGSQTQAAASTVPVKQPCSDGKAKVAANGNKQVSHAARNEVQEQPGTSKPQQIRATSLHHMPSEQPEIEPNSPVDLSDSDDESSSATQHHMPRREINITASRDPKQKQKHGGVTPSQSP